MRVSQFVDDDLGCASYLVADEETGEGALVDPAYAVEPFVEAAEAAGVRIVAVLETHTHADHVSGHGRLALEHGVPVAVHEAAGVAFDSRPLRDGDAVAVGSLAVRVIHTPGHRPEHCCFLVGDTLFTGDSLFVGAVARPDLAVDARDGAEGLFRSVHRLLELPDAVRVLPGHVAGSLCGAGMSSQPSSTIGDERRFNSALAIATIEEFVETSAAVHTPRPPNMERIVELNRGPFVGAQKPLQRLEDAGGATVLDVRPSSVHAAGHIRGALNVPVDGGSFGTKAGFVLRPDERIVLHADDEREARLAARRLHAVGLFDIGGWLAGDVGEERLEPVSVEELDALLEAGRVDVIDVREHEERDGGYIPGSRHVPYRLLRAYGESISDGRPIVTICESGPRAAIAASVLTAAGVDARPVLEGGIRGWRERGGAVVAFRRCAGGHG